MSYVGTGLAADDPTDEGRLVWARAERVKHAERFVEATEEMPRLWSVPTWPVRIGIRERRFTPAGGLDTPPDLREAFDLILLVHSSIMPLPPDGA